MRRITMRDLEIITERINSATGSPLTTYTKTVDGYKPNAGNYHLDQAYGGVKLVRMAQKGSGLSDGDVVGSGFASKRDLYQLMQAFLKGLEREKDAPNEAPDESPDESPKEGEK